MENTTEFIHNNQYSLSIRFNSDGFSFYTYDEAKQLLTTKKVSVAILSTNESVIYKLVSAEAESQLAFKSIRLICESDKYTLIPTDFFSEETASDYLHFEHEAEKNEKLIFHPLEEWKNTLISFIPLHLYNAMAKLYPGISIEHHLLKFLEQRKRNNRNEELHVLTRAKKIDILLIKNTNIQFLNCFSYDTAEDFTYFVLNVFEKLSLNTETLAVFIHKLQKRSKTKELLCKYINEITFIEE